MLARNLLTRIWLTFKQHRFETIAIAAVCGGLAAAALIEAYRLNSANVPLLCLQTWQGPIQFRDPSMPVTAEQIRCAGLVESFQNLQSSVDMNVVRLMLLLSPILVGLIYGAPMVARELEQGTAPLSWALSGSRRRWLLGKVLGGVVLIVPLMLAVGLAADYLQGALSPGLNVYSSFENYMGRGVIDVFWALAAFAGTMALGSLVGRTLPALILALVVCFFARTLWEPAMTHFVLQPMAVQQATPQNYSGYYSGNVDLYVYMRWYMDGKPYVGDPNDWWMAHQPVFVDPGGAKPTEPIAVQTVDPSATKGPDTGVAITPGPGGMPPEQVGPYPMNYVIPGSQYWLVTALESGLLLLGALFCAAIAMFRVERRRPY
jgi:ABC-2 family transporter protein